MIVIEAGFTGNTYALDTPRIGWRRMAGTVTASTEADGFDADNANAPQTYSFWKATSAAATWELDAGASEDVSYCGIAAHTLGANGQTVELEVWDVGGASWESVATHVPADDSPILFLFDERTTTKVRISLSGGTPGVVGVVYIGEVTELPQRATYSPSVSFENAKVVAYSTNVTDGGHWVGRTKSHKSFAPAMAVAHLSEAWAAAELAPFSAAAEDAPFFVADRPGDFADSVAYAWSNADIIPGRNMANEAIAYELSLKLVGFKHGA